MNFVWFQSIHTSFECATHLRSHHICTIPNQFICNYFFSIQYFAILWVWKESNHGCFMPVWFHNSRTHILCQQHLTIKFNEFFSTIIIFPTNYWSKNWNMQPINYNYNLRNSMKCFKFICQSPKLGHLKIEQINVTNEFTPICKIFSQWLILKIHPPHIFLQYYITYF